jgi:hypothetical protein
VLLASCLIVVFDWNRSRYSGPLREKGTNERATDQKGHHHLQEPAHGLSSQKGKQGYHGDIFVGNLAYRFPRGFLEIFEAIGWGSASCDEAWVSGLRAEFLKWYQGFLTSRTSLPTAVGRG